MIYKVKMFCKHYKGKDLLDKNIYQIEQIGVKGKDVLNKVTYTGKGSFDMADNLVIYANIFQNNKLFVREYEDIAKELSPEEELEFGQKHVVEPLTLEEIQIIKNPEFIREKIKLTKEKFKTR